MVCREFSLIWSLIFIFKTTALWFFFFPFSSSQYQQYVKLVFNATEPVISSPAAEWCLCLLHILCCLSSVIIISLFPFEERSLHRVWGFETYKSRQCESVWHHGYVWIHYMWYSCSHPQSHTAFTKDCQSKTNYLLLYWAHLLTLLSLSSRLCDSFEQLSYFQDWAWWDLQSGRQSRRRTLTTVKGEGVSGVILITSN